MATLIYHMFSASSLLSLGIYNLISTTRNHLKSPHSYTAKPYHPLPTTPTTPPTTKHRFLRHLPLYLILLILLISFVHQILVSLDSDPLIKGRTPVHRFTSFQSASVLFAFLLLAGLSLVSADSDSSSLFSLNFDLIFALGAILFYLQFTISTASATYQTSDLQAKCDTLSASVSAISSFLCLLLAFQPKLFVADVALAGSICLQGLWVLQTGLSLYVDAFIPDGCHKLLDVVTGVEGSTKCELDDAKLRAVAILDLFFVLHVIFVLIIVTLVYVAVAKSVGIRRFGSYDVLPNTDSNHIQMKALTGTQA